MNFTGTIYRPPYEAWSGLLQVTAGCTHHSCKFCTLYDDIPFKFRASPIQEIESDLKEIYECFPNTTRLFLTGANPFVLSADKLKAIAFLSKQYLQKLTSIGCFARITDISLKSENDLKELKSVGFNRITIGVETGDDEALKFMNKGYLSKDILIQCKRLEEAGIEYNFFYLAGIYGAGKSEKGVKNTLDVFNQLSPKIIGSSMLTVFKNSKLYDEITKGSFTEESETEKLSEVKSLISGLAIKTHFAMLGASNMFMMQGALPNDKEKLMSNIESILSNYDESTIRNYRDNLKQL